jgi:hypothetical protein
MFRIARRSPRGRSDRRNWEAANMAEQGSDGQAGTPEMPAVRTTIVGGRPPGCGKPLGDIPRGIEVLVKKAAVDPAFRRLLMARRGAAADEIGLTLQPAEAALLAAVPAQQLQAVIDRTRVAPEVRPAFLGKAAAVMLVALGVSSFETRAQVEPVEGIRAVQRDSAPASQPATPPAPAPVAGARMNAPPTTAPAQPGQRTAGVQAGQPVAPTAVEVAGIRPLKSEPASQPASQPASRPAVPAISVTEFARLLRQLDASNYKQREEAQAKLESHMPAIADRLQQAHKSDKLSPEQKNRIEVILEKFNPVRPSEIRAMRGLRSAVVAGVLILDAAEVRVEPATKPATKPSAEAGPKK